jgi:hypothetical protein
MAKNMKQIVGAVNRKGKTYWRRVGTAFQNSDESWNIKLDYFPTDPGTTLQMRDIDPRDAEDSDG